MDLKIFLWKLQKKKKVLRESGHTSAPCAPPPLPPRWAIFAGQSSIILPYIKSILYILKYAKAKIYWILKLVPIVYVLKRPDNVDTNA